MAHVGASELIALSEETYVDLAASLIRDAAQLRHYRDTLRPQLARSPLLDARGFARDLEAAYREMWRRWCDVGR
jgi:protein O-GlcNAc transferase